ncbi:hypothetical protein G7Y79_00078g100080 [Physcia stellaris]|nr:hypothetical protein G7Y79_00078g100080 [Physcia stellaris]
MSTAIPTSTSISESAVISAPLSQVWHLIKLQDFHKFWSKLEKSEHDGTVLDVKQEEHSVGDITTLLTTDSPLHPILKVTLQLSTRPSAHYRLSDPARKLTNLQTIHHYITYSVIASTPALSYTSVISTIRCHAVTSGQHEASTFVEWSAFFSSDADAGVIEDARFKRKEALADLAGAVGKK